jgi:hypothetical protein
MTGAGGPQFGGARGKRLPMRSTINTQYIESQRKTADDRTRRPIDGRI